MDEKDKRGRIILTPKRSRIVEQWVHPLEVFMRRRAISSSWLLAGCYVLLFPDVSFADESPDQQSTWQRATFAGGCFWCMEPPFEALPGVLSVISGYTGGEEKNPTYQDVARGLTGHTEAVQITFDPQEVAYDELLAVYWRSMDPTDAGGQFADRGSQYRPGIFVHDAKQEQIARMSRQDLEDSGVFEKKIVVEITPFSIFYAAEAYHQDYFRKKPKRYKRYRQGSGRTGFLKRIWASQLNQDSRYAKPSSDDIRKMLTPTQFKVTQENGTERPFRNDYWNHKARGIYVDVVSGEPLFSSLEKFDSGTGWPSFTKPLVSENVVELKDVSLGRVRVEVRSTFADSHLGHVFQDGPQPMGLRYCINSASLRFIPVEQLSREGYEEFLEHFNER